MATKTKEKKPTAGSTAKKSKRKSLLEGLAYIQVGYNNTIVTITDTKGDAVAWSSSGSSGFKGARKSTPYAAQVAAENAANKAKVFGLEKISVFVKGVGNGRDQAIRGLHAAGLSIVSITDVTPVPHNGCRKKKSRRV